MQQPQRLYRGSQKHKNRPTADRKGTLCPDWTHETASGGYGSDPFAHDLNATEAQQLFESADADDSGRRCYATARGIAFEAKPTEDGSWHGYPVPWEAVPHKLQHQWIKAGKVTAREIKKHFRKDHGDLDWAIGVGTP